MTKENIEIENRNCTVYRSNEPKTLLIQPVDDHDIEGLDSEAAYIEEKADKGFILAAFKINDWNRELSPWQAPPAFGQDGFGEEAYKTLEYTRDILIPHIIEKYGLLDDIPIIIGGIFPGISVFSLGCI